jgi:O-Antigen ligase
MTASEFVPLATEDPDEVARPAARSAAPRTGHLLDDVVAGMLGLAAAIVGVSVRIGPLRIWHLLVVAASLLCLSGSARKALHDVRLSGVDCAVAVYCSVRVVLELWNAAELGHTPRLDALAQSVLVGLAYTCARITVDRSDSRARFLLMFSLPGVGSAMVGVLQVIAPIHLTVLTLALTDSDSVLVRSAAGQFVRATGLVGHWTGFGAYLCGTAAALLVVASSAEVGRYGRRFAAVGIAACGLSCLATLTFSVALWFVSLLVLCGLRQRRRVMILAAGSVLLCSAAAWAYWDVIQARLFEQYDRRSGSFSGAVGFVPETLVYRWRVWQEQTIPAILERPLTGWGQGVYIELGQWPNGPTTVLWPSAESQWFLTLMTGGLVELAVLGVLLGSVWRALRRTWSPGSRVMFTSLMMAMTTAATVPVFTNVGFPLTFWVGVAAVSGTVVAPAGAVDRTRDRR